MPKRRLQDCDAPLASDDGPIFSTEAEREGGHAPDSQKRTAAETLLSSPRRERIKAVIDSV
jgi:hypothetical protein